MRRVSYLALAVGAAAWLGTASAAITLNSMRIVGKDPEALGKFYAAAFDLKETNRIKTREGGTEIFMNFGETLEAAKANKSPRVVIMQLDTATATDTVPHLIFTVSDAVATASAVKAAGGTMEREPEGRPNSTTMIGIAIDPAGNRIELIQPGSRQ
jgi:predicted enzyme related to lactoylglutathione lyase